MVAVAEAVAAVAVGGGFEGGGGDGDPGDGGDGGDPGAVNSNNQRQQRQQDQRSVSPPCRAVCDDPPAHVPTRFHLYYVNDTGKGVHYGRLEYATRDDPLTSVRAEIRIPRVHR